MIEFLKNGASKIVAILLALTVLPILSLMKSVPGFLKYASICLILVLVSPFGSINMCNEVLGFIRLPKLLHYFVAIFLFTPLIFVGCTVSYAILIVCMSILTVMLAVQLMVNGIIDGFSGGIPGINMLIQYGLLGVGDLFDDYEPLREMLNGEANPAIGHNFLANVLPTVAQQPVELVEDVSTKPIKELTEQEFAEATALVQKYQTALVPIAPEIKVKFNAFQTYIKQYTHLDRKLKAVQAYLNVGTKENIEDDFGIAQPIETPIMLVKQYRENDTWKTVPGVCHVTDIKALKSILRWEHPDHPKTGEFLLAPTPYKKPNDETTEFETRFTWFRLTPEYCYAEGLGELADWISGLIPELNRSLAEAVIQPLTNPSETAQTLFATTREQNPVSDAPTKVIGSPSNG